MLNGDSSGHALREVWQTQVCPALLKAVKNMFDAKNMFLNLLLFDVIILLFRDGNGVSAIHYLIRRVPTIIALPGILTSNCHHNDYSVTVFTV